ncbi:MAG: Na+/H+ antiporter [Chitinophagaceae bacterium]|nr:Na+/H+ antiporter [Chitinophagaceae bacterium]
MMHHDLLLVLSLLLLVFFLVMLAQKLRVSYPIFLVLAGLGISLIPGIRYITIDPELIFLIFLPPLLYEAAWYTSWHDFWKWRRPIGMLAFGLVFCTSFIIGYLSNSMIPGFTLAMGFLLGGIISPPDAVAATSVLKNIKVPKQLSTILEGESLINDASSLIVFRFALAAILTGTFSLQEAVGSFFLAAGMGVVTGLVVAQIIFLIHRFLPTTPVIDAALTVMTPYFMYLAAEQFHFSGVMAVVSGGLFISYRSHKIFRTGATRMNMLGVWTTLIFVLNGLVFILIGLELPEVIKGLGDYSVAQSIQYGLIISLVAIIIRMLWVLPIAYVPKWLGQTVRMDHVNPTWKGPLIVGWAGMRGVVSLASALSIPVLLKDNVTPFPHRNLIIFITFIVILVTLVFQGLTLPWLIKWVKIKDMEETLPEQEQEAHIQWTLKKAALDRIEEKYAQDISENEWIACLKKDLENNISVSKERLEALQNGEREETEIKRYNEILTDIFWVQREALFQLRRHNAYSDEEIRKQEYQLDWDELRLKQ